MFKLFNKMFAKDELIVVGKHKRTSTKTGRKKMSKRRKVMNLLSKGNPVSWKVLRNKYDLTSPRALVDTLRAEGNMIYVNKSAFKFVLVAKV